MQFPNASCLLSHCHTPVAKCTKVACPLAGKDSHVNSACCSSESLMTVLDLEYSEHAKMATPIRVGPPQTKRISQVLTLISVVRRSRCRACLGSTPTEINRAQSAKKPIEPCSRPARRASPMIIPEAHERQCCIPCLALGRGSILDCNVAHVPSKPIENASTECLLG